MYHHMEGLIKEGAEAMEEYEGTLLDAALIGAAQRVEHYEMAGYGTVSAFADQIGESENASLPNETLEEEKLTDEKLSGLSKNINAEAHRGEHPKKWMKQLGRRKVQERGLSSVVRLVASTVNRSVIQ
jgi:ferritin-like metal-binding protein YciE